MVRRAVIYARISVSAEESVSVARQLKSARAYAVARGWKLVGEYVDDGVSASRVMPLRRPGWSQLLSSEQPYDAVIIWKVDRLARKVLDFLQVDQALQARGAAIVCVEQSIDMTSGEGCAFAQMLAVFGELEASTISARATAARLHLLSVGRSPGGVQPYGWLQVPNPAGPGYVGFTIQNASIGCAGWPSERCAATRSTPLGSGLKRRERLCRVAVDQAPAGGGLQSTTSC